MRQFNYQNAQFDYEPYPICYIPDFIDEAKYKALNETYPDLKDFKHKGYIGEKYSLSELNNPDLYFNFLKTNAVWNDFYKTIKSKEFVASVFSFLKEHSIDLGIEDFDYTPDRKEKRSSLFAKKSNKPQISSRFEFSVLTAKGGSVIAHTDSRSKIVTLVLSFMNPDEWNQEWGGGTDVVMPTNRKLVFNEMNRQLPFEELDVLKTFPFVPNQSVLFIKTFNSWHAVRPMTGPETALRKTVTINIEKITA